jgi:pyrroloquinoline-quinone synthase
MKLDEIINAKHLTTHPFYERWQKGEVTREVLEEYAKQYYAYESALPDFLRKGISHLEAGPAREALEENLSDETGSPKPHSELWLDFAGVLGLSADEVQGAELKKGTRGLVDTYASLCEKNAESALGALYAYESQFSVVAKTKADGLREFYGVTDDKGLEFFDWHSTLDDEHADSLRAAISDTSETRQAATEAIDAWWGMLDQFEEMSVVLSQGDRSP